MTLNYGAVLAKTNIAVTQRRQSKILRATVDAPRYVTNDIIHKVLGIPTVHCHPRQKYQAPYKIGIPLKPITPTPPTRRHTKTEKTEAS